MLLTRSLADLRSQTYLCTLRTDYPSSPRKKKKARSNKKKRPAAQQTEVSDAEGSLLASQLEQLGLPAGFGTSKVHVRMLPGVSSPQPASLLNTSCT